MVDMSLTNLRRLNPLPHQPSIMSGESLTQRKSFIIIKFREKINKYKEAEGTFLNLNIEVLKILRFGKHGQ